MVDPKSVVNDACLPSADGSKNLNSTDGVMTQQHESAGEGCSDGVHCDSAHGTPSAGSQGDAISENKSLRNDVSDVSEKPEQEKPPVVQQQQQEVSKGSETRPSSAKPVAPHKGASGTGDTDDKKVVSCDKKDKEDKCKPAPKAEGVKEKQVNTIVKTESVLPEKVENKDQCDPPTIDTACVKNKIGNTKDSCNKQQPHIVRSPSKIRVQRNCALVENKESKNSKLSKGSGLGEKTTIPERENGITDAKEKVKEVVLNGPSKESSSHLEKGLQNSVNAKESLKNNCSSSHGINECEKAEEVEEKKVGLKKNQVSAQVVKSPPPLKSPPIKNPQTLKTPPQSIKTTLPNTKSSPLLNRATSQSVRAAPNPGLKPKGKHSTKSNNGENSVESDSESAESDDLIIVKPVTRDYSRDCTRHRKANLNSRTTDTSRTFQKLTENKTQDGIAEKTHDSKTTATSPEKVPVVDTDVTVKNHKISPKNDKLEKNKFLSKDSECVSVQSKVTSVNTGEISARQRNSKKSFLDQILPNKMKSQPPGSAKNVPLNDKDSSLKLELDPPKLSETVLGKGVSPSQVNKSSPLKRDQSPVKSPPQVNKSSPLKRDQSPVKSPSQVNKSSPLKRDHSPVKSPPQVNKSSPLKRDHSPVKQGDSPPKQQASPVKQCKKVLDEDDAPLVKPVNKSPPAHQAVVTRKVDALSRDTSPRKRRSSSERLKNKSSLASPEGGPGGRSVHDNKSLACSLRKKIKKSKTDGDESGPQTGRQGCKRKQVMTAKMCDYINSIGSSDSDEDGDFVPYSPKKNKKVLPIKPDNEWVDPTPKKKFKKFPTSKDLLKSPGRKALSFDNSGAKLTKDEVLLEDMHTAEEKLQNDSNHVDEQPVLNCSSEKVHRKKESPPVSSRSKNLRVGALPKKQPISPIKQVCTSSSPKDKTQELPKPVNNSPDNSKTVKENSMNVSSSVNRLSRQLPNSSNSKSDANIFTAQTREVNPRIGSPTRINKAISKEISVKTELTPPSLQNSLKNQVKESSSTVGYTPHVQREIKIENCDTQKSKDNACEERSEVTQGTSCSSGGLKGGYSSRQQEAQKVAAMVSAVEARVKTEVQKPLKEESPPQPSTSHAVEDTPSKKKRGRPVGSKNKSKSSEKEKDKKMKVKGKQGRKSKRELFDSAGEMSSLKLGKTASMLTGVKKKKVIVESGPFIRISGSKEKPTACTVVNTRQNDLDSDANRKKKGGGKVSVDALPYKSAVVPSAALASRCNPNTPWLCALCGKGSSHKILGDLFGPYFPEDDLPKSPSHPSSGVSQAAERQRKRLLESSPDRGRAKDGKRRRSSRDSSKDAPEGHEIWVHEDCVVWTHGVYLVGRKLHGLEESVSIAKQTVNIVILYYSFSSPLNKNYVSCRVYFQNFHLPVHWTACFRFLQPLPRFASPDKSVIIEYHLRS